ncbi:MAG: aminopeptidase [Gammaproteobacteria bacterium]
MKAFLTCLFRAVFIGGLALSAGACSHLYYYKQSVSGHLQILAAGKPVSQSLDDPAVAPELKRQLLLIRRSVAFAREELLLETADSYSEYADIQRPYVVWNVFAAPRLSLQPRQWCFLIVGCLPYKGFFARRDARRLADKLRQKNYDVYLGGVTAYSTLGWFTDPILNTMLRNDDRDLVKLIIHELVHQNIYLKNDTDLNEAVAETIALIALSRWDKTEPTIYRGLQQHNQDFQEQIIELILAARDELEAIYNSDMNEQTKLQNKKQILQQLQTAYTNLKQQHPDNTAYDSWFANDLNNAKIASVSTYRRLVPYLIAIYQKLDGDLAAFYAYLERLGECEGERRHRLIEEMVVGAGCGG